MTFKSDYYKVWEEELKEDSAVDEQTANAIAGRLQGYEEAMFGFVMFLLV
ncbi:MAG: hypothetical protein GX357_00645 [Firmicutes bacterium]|nr:hypothetical protein [Bacillota bacterium]